MTAANRKFRWLTFAVLLYLSLCTVAGIWIADGTLHPPRRTLTEPEVVRFQQAVAAINGTVRDVSIIVADGSKLVGWIAIPQNSNGNAALLLHGLGNNRLGTAGYAELLVARGFTVLLPDARAHGASGGTLATFGLLERDDIRRWTEFLRRATGVGCIYGLGESMGAAQLLQAVGSGATFCSVIAESSFSNFREIAYDRMGQPFHLG
ncbi:MAG TPA: alpha/beta fold hydrolase, partial [Candidatus Sulfotelmatobacter sp.]|nr:alpha/beta fold hydrolase [Candidatus Sulfotelmatobacter sp.]